MSLTQKAELTNHSSSVREVDTVALASPVSGQIRTGTGLPLSILRLLARLSRLLQRVPKVRLHHGELVGWLHRRVLELVHEGRLLRRWRRRRVRMTLRSGLGHVVQLLVLLTCKSWGGDYSSTTLKHVVCRVWRRLRISLPSERLLFAHLCLSGATQDHLLLREAAGCRERHGLTVHHPRLLLRLVVVSPLDHVAGQVATVATT